MDEPNEAGRAAALEERLDLAGRLREIPLRHAEGLVRDAGRPVAQELGAETRPW